MADLKECLDLALQEKEDLKRKVKRVFWIVFRENKQIGDILACARCVCIQEQLTQQISVTSFLQSHVSVLTSFVQVESLESALQSKRADRRGDSQSSEQQEMNKLREEIKLYEVKTTNISIP